MQRKGFGPRLLANIIDIVILIIADGIIALVLGAGFAVNMGFTASRATPHFSVVGFLLALIVAAVNIAYFATDIVWAASPGHRLLGMKITRPDGSPADQQTLINRFIIRRSPQLIGIVAAFLTFIPLIGFLINLLGVVASIFILVSCFMTLRATKLALHDEWSDTAVYGPGTEMVPSGFPVQPTNTATGATATTTTTNVPPPTAPVG